VIGIEVRRHTLRRCASTRRQCGLPCPVPYAIEANVEIKLPTRRRAATLDDMGRYALAQRWDAQHL